MKKKFSILFVLLALCGIRMDAQVITSRFRPFTYEQMLNAVEGGMYIDTRREPENNLGKSLSTMRQEFPGLQYSRDKDGLDVYEIKDQGLTLSFEFRNNRLVKEWLILSGDEGFLHEWFDSTVSAFKKTNYRRGSYGDLLIGDNGKYLWQFEYSTFKVSIIDCVVRDADGNPVTMIIYETY